MMSKPTAGVEHGARHSPELTAPVPKYVLDLRRLEQGDRAVLGVAEGVVDRRVDARFRQRQLDARPVPRPDRYRLLADRLVGRVRVGVRGVEDRADDVEARLDVGAGVVDEDSDRLVDLATGRVRHHAVGAGGEIERDKDSFNGRK